MEGFPVDSQTQLFVNDDPGITSVTKIADFYQKSEGANFIDS